MSPRRQSAAAIGVRGGGPGTAKRPDVVGWSARGIHRDREGRLDAGHQIHGGERAFRRVGLAGAVVGPERGLSLWG